MFRVNNKDIRTTQTSIVSLDEFEQVNVCWDITKSLLNTAGLFNKCFTSNVVHAIKCCLISIGIMYKCFDIQMQVIRLRITN